MDATPDELAGVVDLFGGLTRVELERALSEVAFRAGGSVDDDVLGERIDEAVDSFVLVRHGRDGTDEPLFVAGPAAFPTAPDHAEDLPHILDVEPRHPDREALAVAVSERFGRAVEDVVEDGDEERGARLLEIGYDLETWGPIDVADERDRLDALLE